jgi:hypothetical protein
MKKRNTIIFCCILHMHTRSSELMPLRQPEESKKIDYKNTLCFLNELTSNTLVSWEAVTRLKKFLGSSLAMRNLITNTILTHAHINRAQLQALKVNKEGSMCVTASVSGAVCLWNFLQRTSLRHYIHHQKNQTLIMAVNPHEEHPTTLSLPFNTEQATLWDISQPTLRSVKKITLPKGTYALDLSDIHIIACATQPSHIEIISRITDMTLRTISFTGYRISQIRLHPETYSLIAQQELEEKINSQKKQILGPPALVQKNIYKDGEKRSLLIGATTDFLSVGQAGDIFVTLDGGNPPRMYAQYWPKNRNCHKKSKCYHSEDGKVLGYTHLSAPPSQFGIQADINDHHSFIVYGSIDTRIVRTSLHASKNIPEMSIDQWYFLKTLARYLSYHKAFRISKKPTFPRTHTLMFDKNYSAIFRSFPIYIQSAIASQINFVLSTELPDNSCCIIA